MISYKSLVYECSAKKGIQPNYDTYSTGPPHCKVFTTELKLEGYDYIAKGESNTKKDAEKKASKEYIRYFLTNKIILPSEIPAFSDLNISEILGGESKEPGQVGESPKSAFDQVISKSPSLARQAVGQSKHLASQRKDFTDEHSNRNEDLTNEGDLTIDNAKSLLNLFVQANTIELTYTYNYVSDHNGGSFSAEASVELPTENRTVSGKGLGRTKQEASKKCALAIMRQLYCLGVVFIPKNKVSTPPTISTASSPELNKSYKAVLDSMATTTKAENERNELLLDLGKTSKAHHSVKLPQTVASSLKSSDQNWSPWSPSSNVFNLQNAVSCLDIENKFTSSNVNAPLLNEAELQDYSRQSMDMTDVKQYFSLFQNELTKKYSQSSSGLHPDLATASKSVDCDITKIDFNVYLDMFMKLGKYNEFDVFGYYIATILKWLPKDEALKLKSALISLVKNKTSPDPYKSTFSPQNPHSDFQNVLKVELVDNQSLVSEEAPSCPSPSVSVGADDVVNLTNPQCKVEIKESNVSRNKISDKKKMIINEFKRFKTDKNMLQSISDQTISSVTVSGNQSEESLLIDL